MGPQARCAFAATTTPRHEIKMMHRIFLTAALLAATSTLAPAQDQEGTKKRTAAERIAEFDTNGDGQLDKAERKAAREARKKAGKEGAKGGERGRRGKRAKRGLRRGVKKELRAKFDTDGDGTLNEAEKQALREHLRAQRKEGAGKRGGRGKGNGQGKGKGRTKNPK